jgi:hypothetical protein
LISKPCLRVYERAVTTPMGKLAVIRREDTFTLAPGSSCSSAAERQ